MNIKILTDSTSDITQREAQSKNITVVPLKIVFDNVEYLDGIDITAEEFYKKLEASDHLPESSQPAPAQFLGEFEKAKENGDALIVITLSSNLSGTYQNALLAKNLCEYENIYVIDSLTSSMGLRLLVDYAVELRNKGMNVDEIVSTLESEKKNINTLAFVDTLKYLKKGGRLSSAIALAGSLLNIKLVIQVVDGSVSMAGKARGTNRAFGKMVSLIEEANGIDTTRPIVLGYAGSESTLEPFKSYMEKSLDIKNYETSQIGSTVGVHSGPGACGIAYFKK